MTNGGDNQEWRDFLRTLDVLTASAKADLEAEEASAPQWRPAFAVELLAAAHAEGVRLPETEILCEGNELAVQIAPSDFELRVTLQLQGFAALDQYGGQEARVVSANGAIDYRVRFSASGTAVCMLANKPKIREGLGKFSVLFQAEGAEGEA
jgi:hypothetical protein